MAQDRLAITRPLPTSNTVDASCVSEGQPRTRDRGSILKPGHWVPERSLPVLHQGARLHNTVFRHVFFDR
jgi:hypothetical protein